MNFRIKLSFGSVCFTTKYHNIRNPITIKILLLWTFDKIEKQQNHARKVSPLYVKKNYWLDFDGKDFPSFCDIDVFLQKIHKKEYQYFYVWTHEIKTPKNLPNHQSFSFFTPNCRVRTSCAFLTRIEKYTVPKSIFT